MKMTARYRRPTHLVRHNKTSSQQEHQLFFQTRDRDSQTSCNIVDFMSPHEVVPCCVLLGKIHGNSNLVLAEDRTSHKRWTDHKLLVNRPRPIVGWEVEEQGPSDRNSCTIGFVEEGVRVGQQGISQFQNSLHGLARIFSRKVRRVS